MTTRQDWYDWHRPYDDPGSALSHRLRLVQRHIAEWLDGRDGGTSIVLSVCAGQGRDLLEVLADRPDAERVRAHLVERDPRNAAAARERITAAGLTGVRVVEADAGDLSTYAGMTPADLVLLVGVLGNVTDSDVRATVTALPGLCAPGATVIWTRTRATPDLTPAVRKWFAAAGFTERAFYAPPGTTFSVGVHLLTGATRPLAPGGRLFRFVR